MGTRNLTAVMVGGEYKVAQYCQWDGYPSGQGLTVLEFCQEVLATEKGQKAFQQQLSMCRWITQDEMDAIMLKIGCDPKSPWMNMDQAERLKKMFPHLNRDCGANVLHIIHEAKDNVRLKDSLSFAGNSLFCEWAYVIDLDKKALEVYSGFNQAPLDASERFANQVSENPKYQPIKLLKSYALDDLPEADAFKEELDKLSERS